MYRGTLLLELAPKNDQVQDRRVRERGHDIVWIIRAMSNSTAMIYTSVNTLASAHRPEELLLQAGEKAAGHTRVCASCPRLGRRERSQKGES